MQSVVQTDSLNLLNSIEMFELTDMIILCTVNNKDSLFSILVLFYSILRELSD